MNIENNLDKDLRRIYSINRGTPGHEWFNREMDSLKETQEIDPSKLNLENAKDFLIFLRALGEGEEKSLNFLSKIPKERIQNLKQKYANLSGFLILLDQ